MSIFNLFKNNSDYTNKRFVSKESYEKNLIKQSEFNSQTLSQLKKHGVSEDKKKKLEFFFYTNTEEKAKNLNNKLVSLGYDSHCKIASSGNDFLVTGWTTEMQMSLIIINEWTNEMVKTGFDNDCDFDGWGTNV